MFARWWLLASSVWLLLLGIALNWWEFDSIEEEYRIICLAALFPVFAASVVKLAINVALRCLAFAAEQSKSRKSPQCSKKDLMQTGRTGRSA
jgi:hypothetical protein